ncbi:major facilitator superfamily domain-containing 8-like [Pelobates cultripes]|uniref:Major facilitator superfamily domain-containing 8-like n=1 Tax=Pelobates cultripes TaxID=61616 RepID=A0AAD1VRT6_PELCU|nr:major facilitator superfamily domain-containing 8-like [Pelobates cultripes]
MYFSLYFLVSVFCYSSVNPASFVIIFSFDCFAGGYGLLMGEFVVGVFLQILGLPFVAVPQVSLFSKLTAENTQGFNHGIRRAMGGIATIMGPLWAAGLIENLYIMLGVMMGLLLLVTVMVGASYKYLLEPINTEVHVPR